MTSPTSAAEEKTPSQEPTSKETIATREEAVLARWREQRIFERTLEETQDKTPYVFYDGPPFATGLPHYGHLLAGTIKDVVPRYQTMRGRYVRREWGWDCHGLPIENLIEKELGFQTKKDIEAYGIDKFNDKARGSVLMYDKEWHRIVPRMGRFVDMEKGYKTMDAEYTESIWWAFATLHEKGLIYEGFKSMHICPRCETTLAISEVGMNYKDTKDISVFVKFQLTDEPDTFFVAWTTTPWTLPGNVALAVGSEIMYTVVEREAEGETKPSRYIVANDRVEAIFGKEGYRIVGTMHGTELVGKSYVPVFPEYAADETLVNRENGWKVCAGDFVTTESGTGIVHIAPAFGEDDMELGKKEKLPFVQHVGMDGMIRTTLPAFAGLQVKPKSDDDKVRLSTDIAILKYLQEHGAFFAKENITHSYPYCWRCDTPLLNYAASSWFVDVTKLKPRLIEENREISWIPEHMQQGRFGKWLEGARDWAISRSRYWGAPIPVWKCNKCGHIETHGSVASLRSKLSSGNTYVMMRHGESDTNVTGTVSYKPDDVHPLTDKGRAQAASAASKLKGKGIDLIIASPIERTKETALIVAKELGLAEDAVLFDARIAEVNTGTFNGCPIEEYRAYFADTLEKFTKRTPEGENLEEMKSRIGAFLYETDTKYHGKNILLVTHEYGVWMMESVARGATNSEATALREEKGEDFVDNGEVRELAFAPIPHNERYELDFHRPYIDGATAYKCSCELGLMQRVPEVFDCWFESGAMPFAQFHYMGDERTPEGKAFVKNFPADFIAEGIDQTRGWFYTQLILSTALFDRAPYKSVIVNGLILAEDGQKMSKKLKNYPDPMDIVAKYGADALRFYLIASPAVRGEELRFSTMGVDEIFKKITLRIDNIRSFYAMYTDAATVIEPETPKSDHILDRWILARWFETHAEVTHYLDTHELDRAARPILPFVDDLSTWYVRRSRDRFKSDDLHDRDAARRTTGWVLMQLSKLIAPFMPFLADDLYVRLPISGKKESVHLEEWPAMGVSASSILDEMEAVRAVVSLALEVRAKAGIKVRQPLALLESGAEVLVGKQELLQIIADEVNVKEVVITPGHAGATLDTTITPALKEDGQLRDILRHVQDLRKKAGLDPQDRVTLSVAGTEKLLTLIHNREDELKKSAGISAVRVEEVEGSISVEIDDLVLRIGIAKIL
jgi:isoleucyl-tRNA synthetase